MIWIIILGILGVSSEYLIYIVWRAIRMLALIGLQVISIVAVGAPKNHQFFRMHTISKFQCSSVILTKLPILPILAALCVLLQTHQT